MEFPSLYEQRKLPILETSDSTRLLQRKLEFLIHRANSALKVKNFLSDALTALRYIYDFVSILF